MFPNCSTGTIQASSQAPGLLVLCSTAAKLLFLDLIFIFPFTSAFRNPSDNSVPHSSLLSVCTQSLISLYFLFPSRHSIFYSGHPVMTLPWTSSCPPSSFLVSPVCIYEWVDFRLTEVSLGWKDIIYCQLYLETHNFDFWYRSRG